MEVLPVLAGAEMTRSWVGLEGLTPDEMPIIDCVDGVHVAAGFCGHGFAIGPVVGRLLSERLLDGTPSIDLSAFALARFRSA
jgi:glycine/D-amino acid oxidase-like deaminating enzyme